MDINTFCAIERFVHEHLVDGFSTEFIIENAIIRFGNKAADDEITNAVYDIIEEYS